MLLLLTSEFSKAELIYRIRYSQLLRQYPLYVKSVRPRFRKKKEIKIGKSRALAQLKKRLLFHKP